MKSNIFLSRPNKFNPVYTSTVNALIQLLKDRDLNPITIGGNIFPNSLPIKGIKEEMSSCSGIIILGIPQMLVETGLSKPRTEDQKNINNELYPSVWNQMEGAMAYMLNLPAMIIADNNLKEEGIFENGTLPVSNNHYNLKSSDWIKKDNFKQPFNDWLKSLI